MSVKPAATDSALATLIGICREGQRELAGLACQVRRTNLRLLVLEALDQRTEMLDDLHAFAPNCQPCDAVCAPWVAQETDTSNDSRVAAQCTAGEESTLKFARQLLAQSTDENLRSVLEIHVLRLQGLLTEFRTWASGPSRV